MSGIHGDEEFLVGLGVLDAFLQFGHGFEWGHVGEEFAENPHAIQGGLVVEQVVAACGAGDDVHGREDALVGEHAVEL